ncbi:LacI family DNA-binding transcriptional regulator [Microbacterium invictum]|uniref:LacI family DNA-binding transcriptional regulator n=1 Tax=Microbacterium invictum TaxID=515415 RepID=A0ABZ0VDC9_9MICO|nr:LacI family DNA-binding transcriptional regulator [Microbacterium invictum]WQB71391.1 LacI family DNA-binding transcriptional regulator [Microbacterium invictum]
MMGIADVARLAGVSKSTASRALTGAGYVSAATRERVQRAAAELGYVASTSAVSLVTGRTRNVGVVMPCVNRWFFAEVLEGIQDSLLEEGLNLTLYDAQPGTPGRRRIFEEFLSRKQFDGLIAVGLEPEDAELARLRRIGTPVVSIVGGAEGLSVIALDDDHAARRATDHLIALGHRRILFLGGGAPDGPKVAGSDVERARREGYRGAMADAGMGDLAQHVVSSLSLPSGYAAAVDVLGSRDRPTAIVGVCDEVAIGAIIAARRLGIQVPNDLSVVGIDDHEYAEMFALTTLRQAPREQGAAAVRTLLDHLADPERPPTVIRAQARLVVRNSTGPVNPRRSAAVADASLGRL